MGLAPGVRLGEYEVVSRLGAGGMGEVWRARDARLGRDVAIKVLPAATAQDPDALARFDREARAVAALSHPNILAIFDVGAQDGIAYAVMELLEGATLRERLRGGPLPIRTATDFGAQIVRGLAGAHERGIVHRDLKPENVFVTRDDHVKVLDFGLARQQAAAPPSSAETASVAYRTDPGVIMGTLGYMSPEQARGTPVDARSDIFSFGCVLYEMLGGRRAFAATTAGEAIAAVLREDPPDLQALRPEVPGALARVVTRCLEKNPERRFRTAHDLAFALETLGGSGATSAALTAAAPARGHRLGYALAAVALALVAALAVPRLIVRSPGAVRTPLRFAIVTPLGLREVGEIALAPDSARLAFAATLDDGSEQLYMADLLTGAVAPVAGTVGATMPFWSPDGRHIAYFAQGKLFRMDLANGVAQALCDARLASGGAWGPDGTILIGWWYGGQAGVLSRVSASGGTPVPVGTLDAARHEVAQLWPSFLPDGRFLYLSFRATDGNVTRIGTLEGKTGSVLLSDVHTPALAVADRLLYVRDANLFAQPFDPTRSSLGGERTTLASKVRWMDGQYWSFTATERVLVVHRRDNVAPLRWVDRSGKDLGPVGRAADTVSVELSPDGRRVAVVRVGADRHGATLWVQDLERGTETQLATGTGTWSPVWSPDGSRIAFANVGQAQEGVDVMRASGVGAAEPLSDADCTPQSWSADGRFITCEMDGHDSADLYVLPLTGDRKPIAIAATGAWENHGQFSPDGRWLLYTAGAEVYIQPFPPTGDRWQVSRDGGVVPRWRGDGREVYYLRFDGTLLAADVEPSAGGLRIGAAHALFRATFKYFKNGYPYAVARDGQRFLVNLEERPHPPSFDVTVDWAGAR